MSLEQILYEVNSAPDLTRVLESFIVALRKVINADRYTVFLYDDEHKKYVLSATSDVDKSKVQRYFVPTGRGLTSLIAERIEPLNLKNAVEHPRYFEEPTSKGYSGFLGAPITHRKQILGVVIVEQVQAEHFEAEDEALLVTLSIQLAGTIAQAKATGHFSRLIRGHISGQNSGDIILSGLGCVAGIAMGTAKVIYPQADLSAVPNQTVVDIEHELVYFEQALSVCRMEISHLQKRMSSLVSSKELALFDVYQSMLDENSLAMDIRERIQTGLSAQTALKNSIEYYEHSFAEMDDVYLQEKASDIRSLGQRLLACLQARQRTARTYPTDTILVSEEITAADLAEVPDGRLVGIISGSGSTNSHVAILARALGIPTILGVKGLPTNQLDKQFLIVDGKTGAIYVDPSPKVVKQYAALFLQEQQEKADLLCLRDLPAETLDGHCVSIRVNLGLAINRDDSLRIDAEGVGLFRSEAVFLGKERFLTEKEQYIIYRQLLTAFSPRPVIMRTLDIGSDKKLNFFAFKEENPALGWRGIRVTLDHPELFLVQVRAMLRASEGLNNLSVMFPMVSTLSEVKQAKQLFFRAFEELCEEGLNIQYPSIGIMLEVPSVIYQIQKFLEQVDFVSVGSNDLIQNLLAVDRNNAYVSDLYQSLHPSVLQALFDVAQKVKQSGKWLSICGEMASDPFCAPLLVAMGFDCLSTHSTNVLRVKAIIRSIHLNKTEQLLHEVLAMDSTESIVSYLRERLPAPNAELLRRIALIKD